MRISNYRVRRLFGTVREYRYSPSYFYTIKTILRLCTIQSCFVMYFIKNGVQIVERLIFIPVTITSDKIKFVTEWIQSFKSSYQEELSYLRNCINSKVRRVGNIFNTTSSSRSETLSNDHPTRSKTKHTSR